MVEAKVLGFGLIMKNYEDDLYFCQLDEGCADDFLYKGNRLSVPKTNVRLLFIQDVHESPHSGHFNIQKTLEMLNRHFY